MGVHQELPCQEYLSESLGCVECSVLLLLTSITARFYYQTSHSMHLQCTRLCQTSTHQSLCTFGTGCRCVEPTPYFKVPTDCVVHGVLAALRISTWQRGVVTPPPLSKKSVSGSAIRLGRLPALLDESMTKAAFTDIQFFFDKELHD